jgi:hypothetical protein
VFPTFRDLASFAESGSGRRVWVPGKTEAMRPREYKPTPRRPKGSPAPAPSAKLQARKRQPPKVSLNTYVSPATQQRMEWFRSQGGYTVTDVVEVALNEFLDKAGVPQADDLAR